jgi:hypothetical protein
LIAVIVLGGLAVAVFAVFSRRGKRKAATHALTEVIDAQGNATGARWRPRTYKGQSWL